MLIYGLVSMFFCLVFLSSEAESAFTEKGGVRPMGMGGAFVALADDNSAIMFNPAGLGQLDKAQVTAAYDRLYAGLGDDSLGRGFVSYVQPSQYYGAFALNLAMLHAPLYRETTVTFGYGRSFGQSFYLGLNAKGLFAGYEENDYTEIDPLFSNGTSTNGVALDLGMLYKLTNSMSFGLAVMNVNQPNMAIGEDAEEKVPLTLQTGIALKLGNTVPTVDITYRNKDLNDKKDINFHVGIESWVADRSVALRGGFNRYDMALGASYVFSHGTDMEAQLDYAFRYPLFFKEDSISGVYGTHQFSLDVRFAGFTPSHKPVEESAVEIEDVETDAVGEMIEKAMEYGEAGQHEKSIELCDKILEMNSREALECHAVAYMQKGKMLIQLGKKEEAMELLKFAVEIAPRDPRMHYELGMLYKHYGDSTGNISWYNKAIIQLEKTRMIDSKFKNTSEVLGELHKIR